MSKASTALLVVAAAVGGGIAGSLATSILAPATGSPSGTDTAEAPVAERLVDFERRLVTVERRQERASPGRARAREAGEADSAAARGDDDGPGELEALDDGTATERRRPRVDQDFVDSVRAAIEVIRREDDEAAKAGKSKQDAERFLQDVNKRLLNYQERLGLSDAQIADVNRIARESVAARQAAQDDGKTQEQLQTMDRGMARAVRDTMGAATYRAFRKLELDRVARPYIVRAAANAGVDADQRRRVETLLANHIERMVDNDIRVRTEDLTQEERQVIRDEVQTANRDAWDRLRYDILTEEQRDRVPGRLR